MDQGQSSDLDDWNPDNFAEHEYRIWASNDPEFYVVVDQEDYSFLAQFSWSIHTHSDGKRRRPQLYLRRSVSDFYAPDGPKYESEFTGKLVRNRKRVQRNLFLHFVIMVRKTLEENCYPPDKHHHIVDHANRNTRNCRRSNLQWATPSHSSANQGRHVNRKS
jgi:hypothetical protein